MNGSDILDDIKMRHKIKSDANLAKHLGLSSGRMSQLRSANELTSKQVLALLAKAESAAVKAKMESAVLPIIEYYPIKREPTKQDAKWDILPTDDNHVRNSSIRRVLEAAKGIYVLYDSQGVALYVGKTEKQNIWKEMNDAFNRERSNHQAYFVQHPSNGNRFEPAHEKLRQPVKQIVYLCDTAHYFSAYKVPNPLVPKIEALLVRAFCNSLSNKKMEKF
ncbi:MAG TPA: hypothetical protein VLZ03_11865 [Thermodesulfobacteriota bacterium]|nr:hypothetical protein [Thermodesulfobacteriota bacterium]